MKGPELFLLSVLSLPAAILAGSSSVIKGARNLQVENFSELDADFYHKSSSSSDEGDGGFSGDFNDNSQGYCLLYKLDEVAELSNLIASNVNLVFEFLDEEEKDGVITFVANKDLENFADLVRVYYEDDTLSDLDALSSVMIETLAGPERPLTRACITALDTGVVRALTLFNMLMGVGKDNFFVPLSAVEAQAEAYAQWAAMDYSLVDSSVISFGGADFNQDSVVDTRYTYILQFLEADLAIFNKWRDFTIGTIEVDGPNSYFNSFWRSPALDGVGSWFEFAISSVPIVAKYGAVFLRDGEQFRASFEASNVGPTLQTLFDGIVATCNAPTEAPSKAPSFSPMSVNENLMVIAVNDFTDANQETITASWNSFRTNFPDRPFCLLQPVGFTSEDLRVPESFATDPKTIYQQITIDNNDPYFQSDWYDLCDLYRFEGTIIDVVPLYNGLEPESQVGASETFLENQLAVRGGSVITVGETGSVWNWIDPLNVNFVTTAPSSAPSLAPSQNPSM